MAGSLDADGTGAGFTVGVAAVLGRSFDELMLAPSV
jgi:hypothetical protein